MAEPLPESQSREAEVESRLIGKQRRDPQEVRDKLAGWLHRKFPEAQRIDLPLPASPSAGGSSESFFITPTIHEAGAPRTESWIVRIEPRDHRIYEQRSIERQFAVMQELEELGAAPVPHVLWLESDASILGEAFLVMSRVAGVVPHDRYHAEGLLKEATPDRRRAIWTSAITALAGIHGADPARFAGLDRPGFGADPVAQELAVWDSYVRWLGLPLAPAQRRAQQWLRDNRPRDIVPGLSWGDARVPNMIFQDDRCQAVLDWETVSLCGAENDLAWMIFYDWLVSEAMGIAPLEGTPDRDAILQMWSALAGREPRAMHWHDVAAAWRFSLLRDRSLNLAEVSEMPYVTYPDPLMQRLDQLMDRT